MGSACLIASLVLFIFVQKLGYFGEIRALEPTAFWCWHRHWSQDLNYDMHLLSIGATRETTAGLGVKYGCMKTSVWCILISAWVELEVLLVVIGVPLG